MIIGQWTLSSFSLGPCLVLLWQSDIATLSHKRSGIISFMSINLECILHIPDCIVYSFINAWIMLKRRIKVNKCDRHPYRTLKICIRTVYIHSHDSFLELKKKEKKKAYLSCYYHYHYYTILIILLYHYYTVAIIILLLHFILYYAVITH